MVSGGSLVVPQEPGRCRYAQLAEISPPPGLLSPLLPILSQLSLAGLLKLIKWVKTLIVVQLRDVKVVKRGISWDLLQHKVHPAHLCVPWQINALGCFRVAGGGSSHNVNTWIQQSPVITILSYRERQRLQQHSFTSALLVSRLKRFVKCVMTLL